jgi:8-amino-7-oxononanoate synthase
MSLEFSTPKFIANALLSRKQIGSFRELPYLQDLVDFHSNDYLGFSGNKVLIERVNESYQNTPHKLGATGARLISGNSELAEKLEQYIASFHSAESALLFNSGYDANLGLFSCVASRSDTILYDSLVHASIRDGIRLSFAKNFSFQHNSVNDLKKKLAHCQGNVFIAVESLYSMDGDFAPLLEIVALAKEKELYVIVDEAHSNGVFGENGCSLVNELGIENEIFARVVTFGKALGVHGAAVVGSSNLKDYLINFARSFIYSTSFPPHSLICVREAYKFLKEADYLRKKLFDNIKLFRNTIGENNLLSSDRSPIQAISINGNKNVIAAENMIKENGFVVKAVMHPTVAEGSERLRICIHAFNTEAEIVKLSQLIKNIL